MSPEKPPFNNEKFTECLEVIILNPEQAAELLVNMETNTRFVVGEWF
jgi:hypothetical protein